MPISGGDSLGRVRARVQAPFLRVCARAGLGKRKPKDLRDTYASQLITCGLQLAYISEQLGHANTDVTAKAYAKWCGAGYRVRLNLRAGEVPADLLARLGSYGTATFGSRSV